MAEQKLAANFRPESRLWIYSVVAAVAIIILAAIRWSLEHPFAIHWDESLYFNDVLVDAQRLRSGLLFKLAGRILVKSWGRPPAFRILALPFLGLAGFHITAARMVSLACYALSAVYVYRATRRMASPVSAALAVFIFCLSPEVVSASIFFGTDAPLYLATSAMLYYLFECWHGSPAQPLHWLGLSLAVGLGFLAKTSFVVIAIPLLAFWLVLNLWGRGVLPSLTSQYKAGIVALLVAAPWWALNFKAAFAYGQYARSFVRNSLGPPGFATWLRWLNTVLQSLLGHAVSLLIVIVLVGLLYIAFTRRSLPLSNLQQTALGACACAGLPLVFTQLSGTNHLLRHISPAVIPLAIAVGILADPAGIAISPVFRAICLFLCACQLLLLLVPVAAANREPVDIGFVNGSLPWRVFIRFDQWDWAPLRGISDGCGLDAPAISYLGGGRGFNPPQIQYPWVARIASTHRATFDLPEVKWLWRSEQGSLNWTEVMDAVGQSDIVVTAPHFTGEGRYEALDNQYNLEFTQHLSQDARFRGPIRLEVGRFAPVELDVFLKKSLACGTAHSSLSAH